MKKRYTQLLAIDTDTGVAYGLIPNNLHKSPNVRVIEVEESHPKIKEKWRKSLKFYTKDNED